MRLRVHYHRPADLVADHDQQFVRGGLLVRVTPPANVDQHAEVDLEIVTPAGERVSVTGRVLQVLPGAGVAVGFSVPPALTAAVTRARSQGAASGAPPVHEFRPAAGTAAAQADEDAAIEAFARAYLDEQNAAEAATDEQPGPQTETDAGSDGEPDPATSPAAPMSSDLAQRQQSVAAKLAAATVPQKIQIALHGNKDERAAILRDLNRTLHPYVLRNPNLQLDEVGAMAKMTTVSPEVLKAIAERREWIARPDIALALVRNPKMPVPIAVKLLANVTPSDLRQLAKDTKTRAPIQQAARKKVIGS